MYTHLVILKGEGALNMPHPHFLFQCNNINASSCEFTSLDLVFMKSLSKNFVFFMDILLLYETYSGAIWSMLKKVFS